MSMADPLKDLFACADLMVSRAGANAICEILCPKGSPICSYLFQRLQAGGDQILNAASFEKQGFSMVLQEEDMTEDSLLSAIERLWEDRAAYISSMESSPLSDAVGDHRRSL